MTEPMLAEIKAALKSSPNLDSPSVQRRLREIEEEQKARFDEHAEELAESFVHGANNHSVNQWMASAKKFGIPTIGARTLSPRMQRNLKGIIEANVALIKSIPAQHFERLQKVLYDGVVRGYDSSKLYRELIKTGLITKRRAALIARDQNNKANSSLSMMRDIDAGITHAIWLHSNHWKTEPRESHLEAGRIELVFELAKGALLENEYGVVEPTWPGQKIGCKCTYMPVVDWGR